MTSLQASLLKAMYASSSSVSPSITPLVDDAQGGVFALSGCCVVIVLGMNLFSSTKLS